MPIIKSAIKKLRQSRVHEEKNRQAKRFVKEIMDKFKKKPTPELFSQVSSALDKIAKSRLLHKNKVARLKSRLSKRLPKSSPKPSKK